MSDDLEETVKARYQAFKLGYFAALGDVLQGNLPRSDVDSHVQTRCLDAHRALKEAIEDAD